MKKIKMVIVLFFSILGHSFGQKVDVERELPPMGKLRVALAADVNYSTLRLMGERLKVVSMFSNNIQANARYSSPRGSVGGGAKLLLNYPIRPQVSVDFGVGLSRFRQLVDFEARRLNPNDFQSLCTPIQLSGSVAYDYYALDIPIFFQFRSKSDHYFELGLRSLSISSASMQKTAAQVQEVQSCEIVFVNFQPQRQLLSPARVNNFSQNWGVNRAQFALALGGGIRFRKNMFLTARASFFLSNINGGASFDNIEAATSPNKSRQMTFDLGVRYELF